MTKLKTSAILILLLLITLIGAALRYYKLGEVPTGLYIDEAAQGYSAYSILKTGKDEFGMPLPVVFRSFTDFKTPVYIYLLVPLIPIFGLSSFTVRFPSFLFSVLTFPLLFAVIRTISPPKYALKIGFMAVLLLAISPWHILFGRTNFECNVALFIYLLGIYLFYLGLAKPRLLVLSALAFGISVSAYHSERLITPLTVLFLVWHFREVINHRKYYSSLLAAIILGIVVVLPTLSIATTGGFLARANVLSIFSPARHPAGYVQNITGITGLIVNSPVYLSTREFISLYISYFSPRYLFNLGDYGLRSSFPFLSTFFVWQLPFYLLGLLELIKRKEYGELRIVTLFLLIVSPLPAALTGDPYTTIRALPLVIPQIIVITIGIIKFISGVKNIPKPAIVGVSIFIGLLSLVQLYNSAIILNEYFRAREWDYGYKQIVETFNTVDSKIGIVVDSVRDEDYIELLFFLKYNPADYQHDNPEVTPDEYYSNLTRLTQRKIGRISVRAIQWKTDLQKDQLLIGDELAISREQIEKNNLTLIREIFYPDNRVAFRIVRTNPDYVSGRVARVGN